MIWESNLEFKNRTTSKEVVLFFVKECVMLLGKIIKQIKQCHCEE
jgi:hypothetical protein